MIGTAVTYRAGTSAGSDRTAVVVAHDPVRGLADLVVTAGGNWDASLRVDSDWGDIDQLGAVLVERYPQGINEADFENHCWPA